MSDGERDPNEQPAERPAAPAPLALVQDFVNTLDVEAGTDVFAEPTVMGRWLRRRGLLEPGERITADADLAYGLRVRAALRSLLFANHDDEEPPSEALVVLEDAALRAALTIRFWPGGASQLEAAANGVEGAVGRLLGIAHAAMAEGTWSRLKICRADTCAWAFYDTSRNRSGKWCSMAVCGNRAKARSYRRRRRTEEPNDG
ncbi:MAG: CGNR zinc finger domain-containing protein [Actinomycetota bacterium]|nr:CGNR zinc finger domain-containing protein [Actinomycetota bacterium]